MADQFLQVSFDARGLVFGRFTRAFPDSCADLRIESNIDGILHARYSFHGTDEENARLLSQAVSKRYTAPTSEKFVPETKTWNGRIAIPVAQIYEPILHELLMVQEHFGPAWIRFVGSRANLVAQVLDDNRTAIARVEATLRQHDSTATCRVAHLPPKDENIWVMMSAKETAAEATGQQPLPPDGPVS